MYIFKLNWFDSAHEMGKRRHGIDKYPEVEAKILSGEYTLREATNRKKNTCEITWKQIQYIFDEHEVELKDFFICSKCSTIFNLCLRNSGQVLKRHVMEKCCGSNENNINNYFVPEYQEAKKRKLKHDDKLKVRDAAVGFVIRDMRPISAVNGCGLTALLSIMTMIGAKYGHLSDAMIESMRLVPSRQTVSVFF